MVREGGFRPLRLSAVSSAGSDPAEVNLVFETPVGSTCEDFGPKAAFAVFREEVEGFHKQLNV